jgi:hypothetical protein
MSSEYFNSRMDALEAASISSFELAFVADSTDFCGASYSTSSVAVFFVWLKGHS